ncbi:MAG: protein phosphatase 2C domain-containing protein [Ruminococcus sp.]|nr:protein phosphatase 2C domain-containing protein [Ruminococcus sp.]
MAFVSAFATDAGAVANKNNAPNEDCATAFITKKVLYLIISDGNGSVGDMKPSGFVVNEIHRYIDTFAQEGMSAEQIKEVISSACYCANRVLMAYKRANNELYTNNNFATLTMAAVTEDDRFIYAHSGDSRLYLIRNNKILQFSKDHTQAQKLCDEGKIAKEQVSSHPDNSILTSALGFPEPQIDTAVGKLNKGDIILAVTDGIHKLLNTQQILDIVDLAGNCEDTCDGLIKYANSQGGLDNMAVFVCYIPQ